MSDMLKEIEVQFYDKLKGVEDEGLLNTLKSDFLGKKGVLAGVMGGLKDASIEEKKDIGAQANRLKQIFTGAIVQKAQELELRIINERLLSEKVDISLHDSVLEKGSDCGGYHPVTLVQRELEDIFASMGFEVLDGPHIEDEFHNFEALNVPATHPARDMQDTFWFKDMEHLLRTHTSAIQIHGMETHKPPFKFVAPGKAFRCESTDASHEMVFHQFEGMMVGEDISVANLIYFMKTLLGQIFKRDVDVRLRPGFFPFVEPGFELDINCLICGGAGCSVCKQQGWVELLPCGMVHPNVLKAGGIDPEKYNGFAFGLGLDRLVMMRYGIDDIRHIHSGDLRFVKQFKAY